MVNNVANDYASYLKLDVAKELHPVHLTVDDMLIRLEEFETLMKVVQGENEEFSSKALMKMLECKDEIDTLRSRVDHLQLFVTRVNDDLTNLERQVDSAENHLGIPDNKLKSLLKPLLNKISKDQSPSSSEIRPEAFVYRAPKTFQTSEYFPES